MVTRLNSFKFCRQDADCCSKLLLTQSLRNPSQSKSILCICWKHRLPYILCLDTIWFYIMINRCYHVIIIICIVDQSTKIMLRGGWWACCPGTSSYAAAFIATDTGGAVWGLVAHITSIWSPWITNLHIMFDHVWYFVDLSCTSVYRGVAKIELCDGVCCFSTRPHIWSCMKLPFLGWLESFCPERFFYMSCQGVQESLACSETQKMPYDA